MPDKYVLDTNIIQSKAFAVNQLPAKLYASSVVLSELMAAANDAKELKAYQKAWKVVSEDGVLLVPSEEDWQAASRVLLRRSAGLSVRIVCMVHAPEYLANELSA